MKAAAPARAASANNMQVTGSLETYAQDDHEPPFDYDESYFSSDMEHAGSAETLAASPPPIEPAKVISPSVPAITPAVIEAASIELSGDLPDWTVLVQKLDVKGLVKQLAQQSELVVFEDKRIELRCENRALASNVMAVSGMEKALQAHFKGESKTLKIHVGAVQATPAKVQAQVKEIELAGAQAIVAQDSTIQALVREFDGMVLPNSVRATE